MDLSFVMAGLDPAIHVFACGQRVGARHKAGHDVAGDMPHQRKWPAFGRPSQNKNLKRQRAQTAVVIHCSSFCFGAAPTWRAAISPFLKIIRVGIDMMPYFDATPGFSSTLSFTILTLSPMVPAISSSAGAIMRHGPHHSAQKSTTTGLADFSTSASKVASDSLPTAMGNLVIWNRDCSPGEQGKYGGPGGASRRHHALVRPASAASRASGGISIRLGTAVHTKAARIGRSG